MWLRSECDAEVNGGHKAKWCYKCNALSLACNFIFLSSFIFSKAY